TDKGIMNGNLIFVTIFLLTLPFVVNGNFRWTTCSVNSLDADIINVSWEPDPVGAKRTILQANVSQTLTHPTTATVVIIFSFNDLYGRIVGDTMHPLQPGITNIEGTYSIIVPDLIPNSFTFSAMIYDFELE
ncbi:838_t:CDS:1, partial [Gigaspora margarita]